MAGPEGERPRVERTPQQPSQPEQTPAHGSRECNSVQPSVHNRLDELRKEHESLRSKLTPLMQSISETLGEHKKGGSGLFENCIVQDLMPSPQEVERRLKEGTISEEAAKQALQLDKEITFRANLTGMLREGLITSEEYDQRLSEFLESPKSE